ncbi:hypothetical protein BWO91_03865 [Plantibacter flavus]|uniref:hypothetical protein n=1 Tax=Plantibacter flavus TaxID=150123 RepID=UPI00099C6626|nr:hypothetical protein [Plantibacter flavus]AQX79234.1 hypothetical protein BWO91_03865 [Plantibacter flavus]
MKHRSALGVSPERGTHPSKVRGVAALAVPAALAVALIVGVAAPAQADARVDEASSSISATQPGSSELIAPAGALFASLLIWGAGAAFATRRRMLAEQREEASLLSR